MPVPALLELHALFPPMLPMDSGGGGGDGSVGPMTRYKSRDCSSYAVLFFSPPST